MEPTVKEVDKVSEAIGLIMLQDLKNIFGLSYKDIDIIMEGVASEEYKNALKRRLAGLTMVDPAMYVPQLIGSIEKLKSLRYYSSSQLNYSTKEALYKEAINSFKELLV